MIEIKHIKENLYFERSNGDYLLIQESVSKNEALDVINKFLKRHNYDHYYTRIITHEDVVTYDVGSWSEFFVLVDPAKIPSDKKIIGTEKDFVDKTETLSLVKETFGEEINELVSAFSSKNK